MNISQEYMLNRTSSENYTLSVQCISIPLRRPVIEPNDRSTEISVPSPFSLSSTLAYGKEGSKHPREYLERCIMIALEADGNDSEGDSGWQFLLIIVCFES